MGKRARNWGALLRKAAPASTAGKKSSSSTGAAYRRALSKEGTTSVGSLPPSAGPQERKRGTGASILLKSGPAPKVAVGTPSIGSVRRLLGK